jgi:small subunit ribosomal protein S17
MANNRRRLVGRVVSDKMDKTVTVALERRKIHPIYKKVVRTTKKVMAHDESNAIEVGAIVRIVESKPLSKNKRWVVEEVLATGHEEFVAAEVETDVPSASSEVEDVADADSDTDADADAGADVDTDEVPAEDGGDVNEDGE